MYRAEFIGKSYEAGKSFGKTMLKNGVDLNKSHIMDSPLERVAFGRECTALLDRIYPQITDEVRGIAEGQGIDYDRLAAFIFGMYCFAPPCLCTCVAVKNGDRVIFGRNSDFMVSLESSYGSFFYKPEDGYAFIGNSTAFSQIEDGVNEQGLAVGLTFIMPKKVRPSLNAGLLVRYLLQSCKTLDEAIAALRQLPIASAQTLTVADRLGNMAVIECCCDEMQVIYPEQDESFVATTNSFNSEKMKKYEADTTEFENMFSKKRYAVAQSVLKAAKNDFNTQFVKDLLSGRYGFMCQHDRSFGGDTVWSSIYEIGDRRVLICEGNPSREEFQSRSELKFSY